MKSYFVSFNIVDVGGRGIVGSGNTVVELPRKPTHAVDFQAIERGLLKPNLPAGLDACIMNIVELS